MYGLEIYESYRFLLTPYQPNLTPFRLRKIAKWLLEWADWLEQEEKKS